MDQHLRDVLCLREIIEHCENISFTAEAQRAQRKTQRVA
jgi:hypothetical protein